MNEEINSSKKKEKEEGRIENKFLSFLMSKE